MQFRMPWIMGLFALSPAAGSLPAPEIASQRVLSLAEARALARHSSPEIAAARAAVQAAIGRERQAGAFPNPAILYSREQTSRAGATNAQDIALFEQRLEITGQPGARAFRRHLATEGVKPGAGIDTLRAAVAHVRRATAEAA